jgi:hypothetical protein
MQFENPLDNGKAKAGAVAGGSILVLLIKTFENPRHIFRRDATPGIRNPHNNTP